MDEDINYDSFGTHSHQINAGRRGLPRARRVCARLRSPSLAAPRERILMSETAARSPTAFLISIAHISLLLLISSYGLSGSHNPPLVSVSVSTARIALSHDLLSPLLYLLALASFPAAILPPPPAFLPLDS